MRSTNVASGGKYNLLCFMSHKYTCRILNVLIVDYRPYILCKFESKVVPSLGGGANCLQ